MFDLFEKIEEALRELLTTFISSNLTTMFTDVNEKTGTIAQQVGQTPQGWNGSIFAMIQGLSQTVIVPIAGMIITFVLCYELISMVTERNNLHDTDTWMFFKWVFKAFVAVYLVTNTFNITMAIFDVGQRLVSAAAGVIGGNTSLDVASTITTLETSMETMELGELLQLAMETMLVSMCMKIISILITVVLYGRMIEIYLYTSVAPVPFATLTNREWGQVGNNYARGLIALGFQGFFIMVIVGIYCVLVNSMTVATDIHSALFSIAAYTVILCFALFKTGSVKELEKTNTPVQVGRLNPGIMITDFITHPLGKDGTMELSDSTKKVYNILGDKPDVVAEFLVKGMIRNVSAKKQNDYVAWLTKRKAMWRFMTAAFNKRNFFEE